MRDHEWEDDKQEDETYSVEDEIRSILKEMKNYSKVSQEYMVLSQRLADLSETKKNLECADNEAAQRESAERTKNAWAWQIGGNILGGVAGQTISALFNRKNVKTVVGYEEEGGLVKSSGMKFIK